MSGLPDPGSLKSFDHAAAGHDGVLTDEDNTIVVKPCTPAEVSFYQSTNAEHPQLAYFMPRFLGTLDLNTTGVTAPPTTVSDDPRPTQESRQAVPDGTSSKPARVAFSEPLRMKGKAIDTDTCIVLSAVTAGFKQPNVLDLKLGSRLWAADAQPAKRARLDKVSSETTSGSLGFRIAGMRVWRGPETDLATTGRPVSKPSVLVATEETVSYDEKTRYLIYNKLYGRSLDTTNVITGFKAYFDRKPRGLSQAQIVRLIRCFWREVDELIEVLRTLETRMYSSSILLVFEGDPDAHQIALLEEDERWKAKIPREASADSFSPQPSSSRTMVAEDQPGAVSEEDEDEEEPKSSYALKMIDFAHATWEAGEGPDENVLHGLRSIANILKDLELSVQKE